MSTMSMVQQVKPYIPNGQGCSDIPPDQDIPQESFNSHFSEFSRLLDDQHQEIHLDYIVPSSYPYSHQFNQPPLPVSASPQTYQIQSNQQQTMSNQQLSSPVVVHNSPQHPRLPLASPPSQTINYKPMPSPNSYHQPQQSPSNHPQPSPNPHTPHSSPAPKLHQPSTPTHNTHLASPHLHQSPNGHPNHHTSSANHPRYAPLIQSVPTHQSSQYSRVVQHQSPATSLPQLIPATTLQYIPSDSNSYTPRINQHNDTNVIHYQSNIPINSPQQQKFVIATPNSVPMENSNIIQQPDPVYTPVPPRLQAVLMEHTAPSNGVGSTNTESSNYSSDGENSVSGQRKKRRPAPTLATGRRNLKEEPVDDAEADRRRKRRERNRKSAQKCRERKVVLSQELRVQVDALKADQAKLADDLNQVLQEARYLYSIYQTRCPPGSEMPFFHCLEEALSVTEHQDNPQSVCHNPAESHDVLSDHLTGNYLVESGITNVGEIMPFQQHQEFTNINNTMYIASYSLPCTTQINSNQENEGVNKGYVVSMPTQLTVTKTEDDTTSPSSAALLKEINWRNFHEMAMSPEIDIKLPLNNGNVANRNINSDCS